MDVSIGVVREVRKTRNSSASRIPGYGLAEKRGQARQSSGSHNVTVVRAVIRI